MAKIIEAFDPHTAWATMGWRTLVRIFISGLIVGAATYVLFLLLERYVFEPIMCRESVALARCESKQNFASGVAILLGSMLGLILLVRERVYRPILAILGVVVSLWGVFALVATLPWLAAMLVIVVTFGISYVLYSWLVQPASLVISILLVLVAAAAARVALTL